MSDHDHDPSHDAHAGHGHSHGHSHEPAQDVGAPLLPQDAAGASLSRALSMSFRMLTGIMFAVLVLFFFTGVTTIRPGQKGIVTVFGREVSLVGPGLHYTWPFPIGKIEVISVAKREVEMWEFWPSLSPEDRAKDDLSKATTPAEGLRPGWDGALLTGDAYLFHVRIKCVYEVEDPLEFVGGLAPEEPGQPYADPNLAVRTAVCRAAIRAAAHRTAESVVLGGEEQGLFKSQILAEAQECLKRMGAGIRITQINLGRPSWPIRALPDFQGAQNAEQMRSTTVENAIKEARNFLGNAAGPDYRVLVGDPWDEAQIALGPVDANYNLIGQYEKLRRDANAPEADRERLLARIDEILLSQATQGEVASLLGASNAYKDAQKSAVASRAENLQKLLVEYRKDPDFFLQRMWTEAREEILQSPTVVKWFLSPSQGKTIVQINTPPEIVKEMMNWWLRSSAVPAPSSTGRPSGPPHP